MVETKHKRAAPGPYGCEVGGKAQLTPTGQALLASWAADFPHPGKLLAHTHRKIFNAAVASGLTHDEIESLCFQAAVKAMVHWKPEKAAFSSYVAWWMRQYVARHLQYTERNRARGYGVKILEGNRTIPGKEGKASGQMIDLIGEDDANAEAFQADNHNRFLNRRIVEIVRRHEPNWRRREMFLAVHGLRDGEPQTLQQVGQVFGISRERVRQLVGRITKKIEPYLEELYLDHVRESR